MARESERASEVAENLIEMRVNDIAQLFHTLDPFPFRERDLAEEAEDYDWWPLAHRRDLYNRLSVATVESKLYSISIETPSPMHTSIEPDHVV